MKTHGSFSETVISDVSSGWEMTTLLRAMKTRKVLQSATGQTSFHENDLGVSRRLPAPREHPYLLSLYLSLSQCLACRTIWPPALLFSPMAQAPLPQVGSASLELRTGNRQPLDATAYSMPFYKQLKRPSGLSPSIKQPSLGA